MAMIFDSVAPAMVAQSIQRLREEADRKRVATYERNERFFLGGDSTKPYLWPHEGEGSKAWIERQKRFTDCGLTGRIANALIAALYGKRVDRILFDDESGSQELADILDANNWEAKQRFVGQGQVVFGDAWVSVRWSDALDDLKLHIVDPANMTVLLDPEDPMRETVQIERVIDPVGDDKPKHWIWTKDKYTFVDANGAPLLEGEDLDANGWRGNPYGIFPYIHWRGLPLAGEFWGIAPIRGVVEVHEMFNNRSSQLDRLILFQAHSLLAIYGLTDDRVRVGESNALIFNNAESKAEYISPSTEIAQVRESMNDLWQRGFDVGGVPISIIRGGEANSGFQLVQEYRTMSETIEDLKTEAKQAEVEFVNAICRIGSVHGLPLPENPIVEINFNAEVVPADRQAEFDRDYLQLTGTPQTMTRRDFLMKWEGKTEETVDEYIRQLDEEASARQPFGLAELPPAGSVL